MSTAFSTAQAESRKLKAKPTNDELLELYALFKIGSDHNITTAGKVGMFDLESKAKRNAWDRFLEEGLSKEDAQTRYVKLVDELKEKYGYDAEKALEAVGGS